MSVDPEMLMAYADGELDPIAARRVERAIAADPALAGQVERHRALRDQLRRHFDPIAEAPPPAALAALVRDSAKVVPFPSMRPVARVPRAWAGGAVAAALALGVLLGQNLRPGGDDFAAQGDRLVASGAMAQALDKQLASTQPADARLRMLVSFRTANGSYCRTFAKAGQGGIACRENGEWQLRELRSLAPPALRGYRQAGSETAALMADAQELMAGDPLDARAEDAAAQAHWTQSR